MAASIAHELNQPLTASANYLNGSRRLLDGRSDERVRKARDALAKAAKEALRAGEVIRRLRDFIKQGEIDPKVENVKAMVEEAVALALHETVRFMSACSLIRWQSLRSSTKFKFNRSFSI
jgi:two-component system sensor kinase FixL